MMELIGRLLGTLRLELGKESYERCGLNGKPIRDVGRKHIKARYGMHRGHEKTDSLLV